AAVRAFDAERREHSRALETLVERAQDAGALRPGVTVADVRAGLLAIASFRGGALPSAGAESALERLTRLLLAGLGNPRA
ncbi:MAG: regulatory protein TetR, partial [Frondihabitans sp.]|nr:regulatory protein TetR [Frondihabitans sp.]